MDEKKEITLPEAPKLNPFIAIFARMWALWAVISFAATFLIIFIPSMATKLVKNPKGIWWFILIAKWWNTTWLYLVGSPITVYGKEHFQKGKTYVVTSNHNALLDVPLLCPFVPGANQTIAKDTFTKVPIFGWYYARGSVLVNRDSVASRKKSFDLMKAALKAGFHMCIFPEGTRNKTGNPMAKFQDGAFKLSRDTKTPIIPCVIIGSAKACDIRYPFFFVPTPIKLHFLPPVEPEDLTIEALKLKVFTIMHDFYVANS